MKTLSEIAELPGRKTNHSARKTTVQKLCNSGIPNSTVLQVSSHRNVHSLNNYKKPSLKQQQSISHLLSCYSTQPNPSTSIPIPSSSTTTYKSTVTDITNQQHNIHHVFKLENGHAFWLLWYFSKRSSTWRQCC